MQEHRYIQYVAGSRADRRRIVQPSRRIQEYCMMSSEGQSSVRTLQWMRSSVMYSDSQRPAGLESSLLYLADIACAHLWHFRECLLWTSTRTDSHLS